jgi:hypothetical protein
MGSKTHGSLFLASGLAKAAVVTMPVVDELAQVGALRTIGADGVEHSALPFEAAPVRLR